MWESSVSRLPSFLEATSWVARNECDLAMRSLAALRDKHIGDPHSVTEIDRWIARALAKDKRNQEAYDLLQQLRPRLEEFFFDLSLHHLEVVRLLQELGDSSQVSSYCASVSGHFWTNDALGHLDWIHIYANSSETAQATDFMYTIIAVCVIRLGLDVPPRGIAGLALGTLVGRCIKLRDRSS